MPEYGHGLSIAWSKRCGGIHFRARHDDLRQRRPTRPAPTHQLDRFLEAGGNLVDTADVYTGGDSEEIIGRGSARRSGRRETRSCWPPRAGSPRAAGLNDVGLSRRHLRRALDASLRRLGVDLVDLYQLHAWDPLTPLEETLRFLDDAVRAGKIHYVGLSNFTGWQLQRASTLAERRGLTAPVTLQPQYNLLVREIEWEIVAGLRGDRTGGAALVAARRRLADREVRRADADRPGRPGWARTPTGASRPTTAAAASSGSGTVIDTVREVADRSAGLSMAQVALAWLVDRPAVTSVILGRSQPRAARGQPRRGRPAPVGGGDGATRLGERPGDRRLPLRRDGCRAARSRAVLAGHYKLGGGRARRLRRGRGRWGERRVSRQRTGGRRSRGGLGRDRWCGGRLGG